MDKFIDKARSTGNPTKHLTDMDEDDDDKTVNSGSREKFDQKLTEISIKWCFNQMTDETAAKAALANLLTLILQIHHDTTTLIDHKSQEFSFNNTMNEKQHLSWIHQDFKAPVHQTTAMHENHLNRLYVTHKLQTTISFSAIKSHYLLREKMKEYNAYLTLHQFAIDQWDIAHLGFFQGYNIQHISKQHTKLRLMRETQSVSNETPPFALATSTIRSAPENNYTYVTQAYEIQCARADASKLTAILKQGIFRQTMAFVPYAYKKLHPGPFRKAIQLQNENSADMWVLKVHGFTDQAMEYLTAAINSQPGFHAVTPTKRGADSGEWKILVHKDLLKDFYRWLQTNMDQITSSFPADLMIPDNYPSYTITSREPNKYHERADDHTDNESFGTMLTNAMEEQASMAAVPISIKNKPSIRKSSLEQTYADIASHPAQTMNPNITSTHMNHQQNPSSTAHLEEVIAVLRQTIAAQALQIASLTDKVDSMSELPIQLQSIQQGINTLLKHHTPVAQPQQLSALQNTPTHNKRQNIMQTQTTQQHCRSRVGSVIGFCR